MFEVVPIYVRQKCINFVEISLVVLKIWKVEFGNFTVPVYNTLVCSASSFVFLAAVHITVYINLCYN